MCSSSRWLVREINPPKSKWSIRGSSCPASLPLKTNHDYVNFGVLSPGSYTQGLISASRRGVVVGVIRDLKQARTATAVNKQLNFTVKNKPHTTNYIYCIFEAYLWLKVCERTVLTVLKSILSNTFHRGEGCRRPEDVKVTIFPSSARRQPSRRW